MLPSMGIYAAKCPPASERSQDKGVRCYSIMSPKCVPKGKWDSAHYRGLGQVRYWSGIDLIYPINNVQPTHTHLGTVFAMICYDL